MNRSLLCIVGCSGSFRFEPLRYFRNIEDKITLRLRGQQMSTITKKDLIDRISDVTQAKRVVVKRIVQQFLDEVVAELAADNRLEFRDFGVFETRTRAAREAQNPKTLERVQVPTKRSVKFKMGRLLKEKLAKIPTAEEPQQTL